MGYTEEMTAQLMGCATVEEYRRRYGKQYAQECVKAVKAQQRGDTKTMREALAKARKISAGSAA